VGSWSALGWLFVLERTAAWMRVERRWRSWAKDVGADEAVGASEEDVHWWGWGQFLIVKPALVGGAYGRLLPNTEENHRRFSQAHGEAKRIRW
jgi:hypothetical protein